MKKTDNSREEQMFVITRKEDGVPDVFCDPGVVDLVMALNKGGLRTVWSCDGHGQRPAIIGLQDGRQLMVFPSLDEAKKVAHLWPGINGEAPAPAAVPVDIRQFRDAVLHAYGIATDARFEKQLGELLDLIESRFQKAKQDVFVCTGDEIRCHDGHGCECAMRGLMYKQKDGE